MEDFHLVSIFTLFIVYAQGVILLGMGVIHPRRAQLKPHIVRYAWWIGIYLVSFLYLPKWITLLDLDSYSHLIYMSGPVILIAYWFWIVIHRNHIVTVSTSPPY